MRHVRKSLLSVIGALAGASLPTIAHAQSAIDDRAAGASSSPTDQADPRLGSAMLDDIVVTARKRSESLQNVPVSVTAFSGEDLRVQNVSTVADVQRLTPNLRIREAGGNTASAVFSVRGQVNNEVIATQDASVGLYVDGLYWARAVGANAAFLDVAATEVLKGPQGTLFGRNTTGGAMIIRTNDPDTAEFGGSVTLGYGSFNRIEGTAVVNLPLGDQFALRVAAKRISADGEYYNVTRDEDERTNGTSTFRVKLLWKPADNLQIVGSYEYFRFRAATPPWIPVAYNPLPGPQREVALEQAAGANFGPITNFIQTADSTRSYGEFPNRQNAVTETATGTVDWDFGPVQLKAIGGYRTVFHHTRQDLDGTPYRIQTTNGRQDVGQYSGELQLNGQAFEDRLDYVIGAFAFREKGYDTSTSFSLPLVNPSNPNSSYGNVKATSRAIYGQATYRITDALSFTGGLRYSKEKKNLDVRSTIAGNCVVPVALRVNGACTTDLNTSDAGLSYTAGLDYKVAADALVYAKTSRGFRSGGINLRGNTPQSLVPFKPEKITDYEVGLKTELFDRRLRINIAAFYSDYKQIQRATQIVLPVGTGFTTTTLIGNAAAARIMGGEAEFQALITDELQISGTLGLLDPKYKSFPDLQLVGGVPTIVDRSNEKFDFVPKTTASASVQYKRDIGFGELLLRADYSYTSTLHYTQGKNAIFTSQRPFSLVNARAQVTINENMDFAIYGVNIFDKRYRQTAIDFSSSLGVTAISPSQRGRWGAEVSYRF